MLIKELQAGQWLLPKILTLFENALNSRIGFQNSKLPNFLKTAINYKLINTDDIVTTVENQTAINDRNINLNQKLIDAIIPGYSTLVLTDNQQKEIKNIWSLLNSINPDLNDLFGKTITNILMVESKSFNAASSPLAFGCLFLSTNWIKLNNQEKALSLVHELAHHELFLINTIDRLVRHAENQEFKYSPLPKKMRPTIGRLHASHALFRLVTFKESIGKNSEQERRQLHETCSSFNIEELTVFSERLIKEVYMKC